MGSYLTQPITEKISDDGHNSYITFGSSSMQGWRLSQEDAHNCCLDFGKNASFFAVYDGHGGAEVALYCSQKLPDFLKSVDAYQKGDFEQALKDTFIGFDSTLVDPVVIEDLNKLIVSDNLDGSETEDDGDDEENLDELWAEGKMELNEVLEKYKDGQKNPLQKLKAEDAPKPISPYLRGRRNDTGECSDIGAGSSGSSSSSSSSMRRKLDDSEDAVSSTSKQKTEEIEEAASSSGCPATAGGSSGSCSSGSSKQCEPAIGSSSTNNGTKAADTNCSPVSSSTNKSEANSIDIQVNGGGSSSGCKKAAISSQENEISTNSVKPEKVTSSSQSGLQSNGEISSNSSASPAANTISSTKNFDSSESSTDDDEYNDKSENDDDEDDDDDDDEDNSGEDDEDDEDDDIIYPEDDDEDGFLNNMVEGPGQSSGCTAVVALLVDRELFVANAGDSRCVLCRDGKTVEMSFDHKPEDEEESRRITNAGGRVTLDGRVNGGLNLSRAIGDHAYKMNKDLKPEEQMISAMPDVKKITLDDRDEFMVLACDGIWNFMTSEEVVEFVRKRLAEKREKLSSICEELFTNCLAANTIGDGTGCDNMTAVIVQFKQNLCQTDDPIPNKRKRSASPVAVADDHPKRLKEEESDENNVAVLEPTST